MADQIEKRVIRIDEMEFKPDKVILKQGKDKYQFWIKKRDGNFTKAYECWQEHRFAMGDTIEVNVKEEQGTFESESGTRNFTRRTILLIRPAEGQQPTVASSAPAPAPKPAAAPSGDYVSRAEFEEKIKNMGESFLELQRELDSVKRSVGITDEDGV